MTWIRTISYPESDGRLRDVYERLGARSGQVDNVLQAHSLRPATLEGHMALYKNVLHHRDNRCAKWFLEAVGVAVSRANRCDYCVAHHREGMRRGLDDDARFEELDAALTGNEFESAFSAKETAMLRYALRLSRTPPAVDQAIIEQLRSAGASDGEILEINQVASYFAYANRTVLGLGVSVAGETTLGLSPNSQDPDDWAHGMP